jgi:hypothetical protein
MQIRRLTTNIPSGTENRQKMSSQPSLQLSGYERELTSLVPAPWLACGSSKGRDCYGEDPG